MKLQREKFDLDLARFGDEELVILAKECEFQPAQIELIERYFPFVQKVIGRWARASGLSRADTEDAQQNGVLSLVNAIARYDTAQLARARGVTFRSFTERVLRGGYLDRLKHETRFEKQRSAYHEFVEKRHASESVVEANWAEARARLQPAIDQLDGQEKAFSECLVQGVHLCNAAAELHISYRTAKRWRNKLLVKLATYLRS